MKATKYAPIDDIHRAGIEIDGNQVLIWIETKKKSWLGSYYKRCSWPVLYHLTEGSDRNGCTIQGGFLGHVMTLQDNERNIDTFNAEVEISILFDAYMNTVEKANRIDKKLNSFINSI